MVGTAQDVIETGNESLYGTLLRLLEKIYKKGVKGANGCKICRLKKKSKSESFSATSDAQKSENINNKCA